MRWCALLPRPPEAATDGGRDAIAEVYFHEQNAGSGCLTQAVDFRGVKTAKPNDVYTGGTDLRKPADVEALWDAWVQARQRGVHLIIYWAPPCCSMSIASGTAKSNSSPTDGASVSGLLNVSDLSAEPIGAATSRDTDYIAPSMAAPCKGSTADKASGRCPYPSPEGEEYARGRVGQSRQGVQGNTVLTSPSGRHSLCPQVTRLASAASQRRTGSTRERCTNLPFGEAQSMFPSNPTYFG